VFCNYDTKLHIYAAGTGSQIDMLDPLDPVLRTLVDGQNGDTSDGVFHDLTTNQIPEIRLLDATGTLTPTISSAVTAVLRSNDGTLFTFDVIPASSTGSAEDAAGQWPLDETSGTTAFDSSGNSNDGTVHGCTITSNGKQNRSYRLNGTSDYIDVGNPTGLNITGNITVAAWVRLLATDGTRTIVSRNDGTNELSLSIVDGQYRWGNTDTAAVAAGAVVNQWVHLAGTFDGTTWRLYRNGNLLAQQAVGTNTSVGAGNWAFGAQGGGGANFCSGNLDDILIFDRTLIQSEIGMLINPQDLSGRLTRIQDRNGYATVITYKTFSPADLAASPERQWQIDTITDPYNRQAQFSYGTDQVSGRWAVSQITLPNSQTLQYSYADGKISQVTHPDGTVSTFNYYLDATAQTTNIDFYDVADDGSHRKKTVYFTNQAIANGANNGPVYNQASLAVRMIVDGANDVRYMNIRIPEGNGDDAWIYEGTGAMKRTHANASAAYLLSGWNYDPALGAAGVTGTLESVYAVAGVGSHDTALKGLYPWSQDEHGVKIYYAYDSDSYVTTATYSDATTEKYSYNSFKQITRYEDRLGRVTLNTYDANGNMTKKEEGILVVGGVDTPQPEYAATQWQFYPAGDPNQYLLQAKIDANGNMTTFSYSANQLLTHVVEPPDVVGGPQAVTQYDYDTAGRLASVTDPQSRVTQFVYDQCSRVVKVIYPDSSTERTI
jgi:YD repeat-containing protein